GEAFLQRLHMSAERLAANERIAPGRAERPATGEDGDVHAGAEVLARRGDDNHPRFGAAIDVANDLRKLAPKGPGHGVQLLAALKADVRDLIGDFDVEAFVGHGRLLGRRTKWSLTDSKRQSLPARALDTGG